MKKFLAVIAVAAVLLGVAAIPVMTSSPVLAQAAKLVPLPIELPKPMFIGTPTPMKVDKLEKATGKPRPPFLAPAGVSNVAIDKPVTGSDDLPVMGELEMLTDGDKEAADGSYVELGPFAQWVAIDLEKEFEIYALVMWHFHKQPRVYYDCVVQIAQDADFTKGVVTVFNNDIDNSLGKGKGEDWHYVETNEGKLVDCKGAKGRFVRAYSNGNTSNDLNHWIELEVYGK